MSLIMTVIAGPVTGTILADVISDLRIALPLAGAPDWLAPGAAYDLHLAGIAPEAAEAAARRAIGGAAIDVLVQPQAGRRKRVLVADFIGRRSEVAEITRRAMNGELDFAAALAERVALLKGLPASVLDDAAARIRVTPGARALVATARASGVRTALVSGGFTVFAERVAEELGFERVVANRLDIVGGRIAGSVRSPIVTGDTKRDTLLALAEECAVARSATLAVGDGANDLPMLLAAGLGIAYHAKPAVAAAARWRIDHADLTALLYAQGYRAGEIVGGA